MKTGKRTLALLTSVVAIGVTAGCGSDSNSEKPASIADAKATLSKDCQNGKSADKKLCDCVAATLEAGGKTAKEILALNDEVKKGKTPMVITTALTDCNK